jgi:hypothetical protein
LVDKKKNNRNKKAHILYHGRAVGCAALMGAPQQRMRMQANPFGRLAALALCFT